MIKRVFAMLLCLGLLLCMIGCGEGKKPSSDISGKVSESSGQAGSSEKTSGKTSDKEPGNPVNELYPFAGTEISASLFENGFAYLEPYNGWSFCARFSSSEIKLEGKEGYTVKLAARQMPQKGLPSGNWTYYEVKLLENYLLSDGYLLRLESEDFRNSMLEDVTYEICLQLDVGGAEMWGIIHMGK